ncbi:MAG: acyl-CoA dehydrogenase [Syntrophomonadaceae bacterium]|nr:acyl-CoA dehydrogenase [Bacillota bacterium]NLM88273.1 acyl-CoA dehydrogenase [Syntrophomonadaceae bacterium]HAA08930.1 acyl-CoA dehydrogenase [Syntrophomonas sp.]HQA50160.1 acyl-CoA dehydrogenase [Syntrophomonadaceae bacterium]HQD89932.1 acyl-CoA dehydrogenase [Syntrophomonadaceae bacterium]
MASNFLYSTRDHKFILKEWLDMEKVLAYDAFKDYYGVDDIDMILEQALKVAKEVVAPTRDDNDAVQAQFKEGQVTVPPSFKDAYWFVQENGWGASNEDHHCEGRLPQTLFRACGEYLAGANAALMPYVLATAGAAGLVASFGNEKVNRLYREKMYSGEWAGTMCLTEPNAGSDVGDLLTKAYPTDEPGVYKIKGTKCFITGGEQDITENIIHLVLARVEGALPGTKGISLFAVPKMWVDDDGNITGPNDVACIGIEHKMGIKGSSTCVMSFGENNECRGYILGNPPDEEGRGQGMAQMFQMMNGARMETGHAALAETAVAFHNAASYATERIQGRLMTDPKAGRQLIIKHEDVRRMLLDLKAHVDAMRALIFKTYYWFDIFENTTDPEEKKMISGNIDIHTPLVKAYCSDKAWELCAEAMQVYGGNGYSEEYPIAELARDVKIYSIWEGTNYIQSMDLVGRKWMMGKGKVFAQWLANIEAFANEHADHPVLASEMAILKRAVEAYKEIQGAIANYVMNGKMSMMPLYATRILHATSELICGQLLLEQALVAQAKIDELGKEHHDYAFYNGKVNSARYYLHDIVPNIFRTLEVIKDGNTAVLDIEEEAFLIF